MLHSDAKIPFTIKVIDSDEVNAFALPGGFFYVNKGLILAADNEAEAAGVQYLWAAGYDPGAMSGVRPFASMSDGPPEADADGFRLMYAARWFPFHRYAADLPPEMPM